MSSLRILITGGFGFVGGRLAVHLAQAGHRIVLGSRNAARLPTWLPQAEVVKTNWNDIAELEHICNGVDVVIHAAGMNAADCVVDPVGALFFNGVATARLVTAAGQAGVQRLLYLSTAHVYASPLVGSITEETSPRNLHPYATSHTAGEQVVLGASQRGELEGIVLRLSNAFGAPAHKDVNCWTLVVNDLCKQAVEMRKLILRSSGHQHRDFVAMSEVCRVCEQLTVSEYDDSHAGIFNLGSGRSQSLIDIAETIQQRCRKILGYQPDLQHKQAVRNDASVPFIYQVSRIALLGEANGGNATIAEVDNLLRYCDTAFKTKRGLC